MKYFSVLFSTFSLVILLVISSTSEVYAQEYNSARLTVLYGNNIPFNFNSMAKIKNGIEIVNGTKFGITLKDLGASGVTLKGFQLNFNTFNNQATLKGDVYEMNLNKIRVKAENAIGLESGVSSDPLYQYLSSSSVNLFTYIKEPWIAGVDDLSWNTHQLNISYDCGTEAGNTMIGESPDNYYVEIEFELIPVGDGF